MDGCCPTCSAPAEVTDVFELPGVDFDGTRRWFTHRRWQCMYDHHWVDILEGVRLADEGIQRCRTCSRVVQPGWDLCHGCGDWLP